MERQSIALPIKVGLSVVSAVISWVTGPFGLLDKDLVTEVPAWILPGISFSALVLIDRSYWISPGRGVITLGVGTLAWATAFAVAGFGWWWGGWLSMLVAGAASGSVLGIAVPRLKPSRQHAKYFVALLSAGLVGSVPFAMGFHAMDWHHLIFAPAWVVPSYIFWNIAMALGLHLGAKRGSGPR